MKFRNKGKRAGQEPAQGAEQEQQVAAAPAKKGKKKKIIVAVAIIAVLAIFIFALSRCGAGNQNAAATMYATATAALGDIESKLSATAPLKPADSYTVSSLMDGTVTEDGIEEGDKVEKDQVLYRLDSTSSNLSVQNSENTLAQANDSYNRAVKDQSKLSVRAPVAGAVVSINVKKGDSVSVGMELATVENRAVAELEVRFPSDDAHPHLSVFGRHLPRTMRTGNPVCDQPGSGQTVH